MPQIHKSMIGSLNQPLISVGIIAYNAENHINKAIDSVLNQTYNQLEIIIIDDGSQDSTFSLINEYNDPRIFIFKNRKNRGVAYSRNIYIENAHGEFLAVLDSDDEWLPKKLEIQVQYLLKNPAYTACGTFAFRQKDTKEKSSIWKYPTKKQDIQIRLMWGNIAIHSTIMLRTEILKRERIFYNQKLKQAEDYELYCKLINFGPITNIPKALAIYHLHDKQLTSTRNFEQVTTASLVAATYLSNLGFVFSDQTLNLYKSVFIYKLNFTLEELKILGEFFNALIKQNKDLKIFDVKGLKKDIAKKWFMICIFNVKHRHHLLPVFLKYAANYSLLHAAYQLSRIVVKITLQKRIR